MAGALNGIPFASVPPKDMIANSSNSLKSSRDWNLCRCFSANIIISLATFETALDTNSLDADV